MNQPSDSLETLVRPHSMWNVKLKTLDYFSCFPVHGLEYLDPASLNRPNTQIPVNLLEGLTLAWGLIWCKICSWRLWIIFVCCLTWCGVFGPTFSKLPQSPNTCETCIALLSACLYTKVSPIWCKKRWWRLWITFPITLHTIWGIWA